MDLSNGTLVPGLCLTGISGTVWNKISVKKRIKRQICNLRPKRPAGVQKIDAEKHVPTSDALEGTESSQKVERVTAHTPESVFPSQRSQPASVSIPPRMDVEQDNEKTASIHANINAGIVHPLVEIFITEVSIF